VEVWEVRIGTLLAYHGLLQYIISKDPLSGNITDRLKVQLMLVGTIGDSGVLDKMKAAGWNYTDMCPYETFLKGKDAMVDLGKEMVEAQMERTRLEKDNLECDIGLLKQEKSELETKRRGEGYGQEAKTQDWACGASE
jgi:hypothetical protein